MNNLNDSFFLVGLMSVYTFTFSLSYSGEGNGNPLQCSCLENPRDGGAWWADVYGVTQSRTRLKWLSSSSMSVYRAQSWGYEGSAVICLSLWSKIVTSVQQFEKYQAWPSLKIFPASDSVILLCDSHYLWCILSSATGRGLSSQVLSARYFLLFPALWRNSEPTPWKNLWIFPLSSCSNSFPCSGHCCTVPTELILAPKVMCIF